MSRQLRPIIQEETKQDVQKKEDDNIKIITTEQLILNNQQYIISLLENLTTGLNRLAKQGGFDLSKD